MNDHAPRLSILPTEETLYGAIVYALGWSISDLFANLHYGARTRFRNPEGQPADFPAMRSSAMADMILTWLAEKRDEHGFKRFNWYIQTDNGSPDANGLVKLTILDANENILAAKEFEPFQMSAAIVDAFIDALGLSPVASEPIVLTPMDSPSPR